MARAPPSECPAACILDIQSYLSMRTFAASLTLQGANWQGAQYLRAYSYLSAMFAAQQEAIEPESCSGIHDAGT